MKSEGLKVNSFEEYEFNQVFAGRNWNAGDVSMFISIAELSNNLLKIVGAFDSSVMLLSVHDDTH